MSIVGYRDKDIEYTLNSLINSSAYPDNLDIVVINQDDIPLVFPGVEVINMDPSQAKGLGYARNLAQSKYNGQKFYLQLDAHHRFFQHWDRKLIESWESTQEPKAILTTYCVHSGQFTLGHRQIVADKFTEWGTIRTVPQKIKVRSNPTYSRFCSGHFFFGPGDICTEMRYDPRLYFDGDEIQLFLRAYTHGYHIFNPNYYTCDHNYNRKSSPRHWEDDPEWFLKDIESKIILKDMIENQRIGPMALGSKRTIAQAEKYLGVKFATREISDQARSGAPLHEELTFPEIEQYNIPIDREYFAKHANNPIVTVGIMGESVDGFITRYDWMSKMPDIPIPGEILANEKPALVCYSTYDGKDWTDHVNFEISV